MKPTGGPPRAEGSAGIEQVEFPRHRTRRGQTDAEGAAGLAHPGAGRAVRRRRDVSSL